MAIVLVALRKESVDRNMTVNGKHVPGRVALRKESVDRNISCTSTCRTFPPSLSARRAWIEIYGACAAPAWPKQSLSARRAWIEM